MFFHSSFRLELSGPSDFFLFFTQKYPPPIICTLCKERMDIPLPGIFFVKFLLRIDHLEKRNERVKLLSRSCKSKTISYMAVLQEMICVFPPHLPPPKCDGGPQLCCVWHCSPPNADADMKGLSQISSYYNCKYKTITTLLVLLYVGKQSRF